MFRTHPQPKPLAIALLAALSAAALPALAQDPPTQEEREATTLDALVVTAQKREEAMQDVPIMVTALSEQALQDAGVRDIKDLQNVVPGLTVTSTQSEAITTARIRGVGTVGDNIGLESSVGVVIDGVYRPRNSVGFGDLGELERIEVLKGPQGTVFGKNTSAGVINVVTKRPSFEPRAEAELTFGNYDAFGVAGSLNLPLGEAAAFSLYAAHRDRDGWMTVRNGVAAGADRKDYDQNFNTVRGKFLLAPTDNLEFLFSADFTKRDENCCTAVQLVSGDTAPLVNALGGGNAIAIPADPFARVAYSNRSTAQKIEDRGVSGEVNWTTPWLGNASLTSITALREWQSINGRDFDFTGADILYSNPERGASFSGFDTFSQEFRLTGSSDSVDWMVGLFYAKEDIERVESYNMGTAYEAYLSTLVGQRVLGSVAAAIAPLGLTVNAANPATFLSQVSGRAFGTNYTGVGALDYYDQTAKSTALFTNNTWHATDALDLTLGLRYTIEKKDLKSVYTNPNGSPACAAVLANTAARVGGALAQRINNFSALPAATQQALLAQLVPAAAPQIAGFMCLPWANALHAGRTTNQSREEKEWSGTLKAAFRWNPNVMTYGSYARGYKAGGFNLDRVQSSNGLSSGGSGILPVNDTAFPGEFVDSFELGAKTTWAGGNLLLNGTLFHQTYSDFQLNSFLGTSFVVRAIPEVVSKGFDGEVLWQSRTVPGLGFQGGLTYADTKYGDERPTPEFAIGATPEAYGPLYKLPGSQVSFAPKLSMSGAVTYEWDFSDNLMGRFNFGAKYMSDFNTGSDLDVEKEQEAFTVANARIGVGSQDGTWMVELWGLNIFDKEYVQVGFDGPLQAVGSPLPNSQHAANDPKNTYNGFLGAPATYGVTLRMRF